MSETWKPSTLEVYIHILASKLVGRFYKNYIYGLGMKGNEKVLELGSGWGANSLHIAKILSEGNGVLTCIDTSEGWMKILKKRLKNYPNVEYKIGDITKLNIKPDSFDAAIIHFMLHDVEQPLRQDLVNAVSRILKEKGKLFIREPTKESHGIPTEEIRQLMKNSGLKEIDYKESKLIFMGPIYAGVSEKHLRSKQNNVR